jgi:glycosyltransferase involved in cell wall biosynthesis
MYGLRSCGWEQHVLVLSRSNDPMHNTYKSNYIEASDSMKFIVNDNQQIKAAINKLSPSIIINTINNTFDLERCKLHPNIPNIAIVHTLLDLESLHNVAYIFTSEAAKIKANVSAPHTVIYNGIELENWDGHGIRNKVGLRNSDFVILYVGRLDVGKRVEDAIDLCSYTRSKLVIVGDGYEMQNLKEKVASYGMEDSVLFRGIQNQEAIANWMASANCLILPSIVESCPLVVLEAMASGLPVIATRVGDVPLLLSGGDGGYLVDDIGGMINAIADIKSDNRGREAKIQVAYSTVVNHFQIEPMINKYRRVIGSMIDEPLVTVVVYGDKYTDTIDSARDNYKNLDIIVAGLTNGMYDKDNRVQFIGGQDLRSLYNSASYFDGTYIIFVEAGEILSKKRFDYLDGTTVFKWAMTDGTIHSIDDDEELVPMSAITLLNEELPEIPRNINHLYSEFVLHNSDVTVCDEVGVTGILTTLINPALSVELEHDIKVIFDD